MSVSIGRIEEVFRFLLSFSLYFIRILVGICAGVVGGSGRRHHVVLESRTGVLNIAVLG